MARTALTTQTIAVSGVGPTYAAGDAVNHHQFSNDGNDFLHVKNTGGSPVVVTVKTNGYKCAGITVPDVTVTVPATSGDRMIGPFDPTVFNQSGGVVYADLASATGITLAALKLPV
jgi:hypothetical protein